MQLSIYREVNSITEWIIRYHVVSSYPILRSFPKTQFFDKNQVFFPKLKKKKRVFGKRPTNFWVHVALGIYIYAII